MDADSSTGLNDNSESGECDSPSQDENTSNTVDFDSTSKLSANSERTNIDALDDTARDTLIVPPADDSSHSTKSLKRNSGRVDLSGDHDVLDFEGDDLEENVRTSNIRGKLLKDDIDDEEDEEGELEDEKSVKSPDSNRSSSPQHGLEEGECVEERTLSKPVRKKIVYKESEKNDGEDDELEEGEVTDDEDRSNKDPKPVCRFFGKGQCTWGSNCRFLHPGVTDKGLYTMFDPMRPLLPIPNNPASSTVKPGLLGIAPPNFPPIVKPEEPIIESAWERGLRNAKEIIKQSVKRKETDIDFEEKKMNLTLAQEEIDKENDYYVRKPASPEPVAEPADEEPYVDSYESHTPWVAQANLPPTNLRRTVAPQKIDPDFVRERVHRLHKPGRAIREAPPRDTPIREAPPLHEPEVRMVRESALRRSHNYADQYQGPHGSRRNYDDPRKAEEWHDPWMRTKSPGARASRKDSSVSKRSSYSSGSSRSSSRSSSSSKSSRSSRSSSKTSKSSRVSNSPPSKKRRSSRDEVVRKAPPRRISPKPVRIAPPPPPKEEFGRRIPGGYGGPPHYDRPPRFAPSPPKMPGHVKDRLPDKNNPPQSLVRERDLKAVRGNRMRPRSSWSARSDSSSRSISRSRSRSRSPWSKSVSKSRSKSRSRSVSSKPRTRSKFSRDRSISGSPSPSRSRSLSRRVSSSRSRSPSSSSSSSSSLGSPTLARTKRKAPPTERKGDQTSPLNQMSEAHLPPKQPVKRMDTGKGQAPPPPKAQIKMTLKSSGGLKANKNVLDRLSDDVKDERGREPQSAKDGSRTPIPDDESSREALSIEDTSNGVKGNSSPKDSKASTKRREELLKQLKAVEDAIAKKRSKLERL